MAQIQATRRVNCAFSAAIEFAEQALRDRRELHVAPGNTTGIQVDLLTKTTDDATDTVRRHEALAFAWKPRYGVFLPNFTGVLTVRPEDGKTSLRLHGSYTPPFGFIGRLFDALVGRTIAQRTIRVLLEEIAMDIEMRWHAFAANANLTARR